MSNRAFWSFLGGLVTGLAIGMLYAPDSGKNTRDKLKLKLEAYWTELKEMVKKKQEDLLNDNPLDSTLASSTRIGKNETSIPPTEDYTRAEELLREVETLLGDMKKS
ncbi:MAG: YtxH domain-containing protein [Bacteroidia bacterium]|nr:YtxH domain-containing protein [Bacteroidia bacterium]